jgi:hypothetical protein
MAADELADFHGPHVEPPTPEHVKLTWHQPTPGRHASG